MAVRILSRILLRHSTVAPCAVVSPALRHRSSQSGKLIEIDLESSPSTSSSSDGEIEVEVLKMRKLEEAIHALFVEKSTPDWLPFIPGSSFWVPPRKRKVDMADLFDKLWDPPREEETFRFANGRGWPMLEFFSSKGDGAPEPQVGLEVEVKVIKEEDIEVKVLNVADINSEVEDTEG
ncbi:hypothetical protein CRG98_033484 [Punica granatum]|uniref:Uncharacterized protein n=1 Tax=Punica granatum TaxID=22663 RepID=A0A2I0IQ68_PUNGR|nr:hypothetical protein CRG98_033484 [Punica granatum]